MKHFPHASRRMLTIELALSLAAALAAPLAHAAFPEKPITLVVPYPPGGASDVLGRITARVFSRSAR